MCNVSKAQNDLSLHHKYGVSFKDCCSGYEEEKAKNVFPRNASGKILLLSFFFFWARALWPLLTRMQCPNFQAVFVCHISVSNKIQLLTLQNTTKCFALDTWGEVHVTVCLKFHQMRASKCHASRQRAEEVSGRDCFSPGTTRNFFQSKSFQIKINQFGGTESC